MSRPVEVPGGTVYLRERLDFAAAHAIRYAIVLRRNELMETDEAGQQILPRDVIPDLMAAISEAQILRGVESWTFDEPVTRDSIRRLVLADDQRATVVADAADDLYQEQTINPLALLAVRSSPPTPSNGLTSVPSTSNSTSTEGSNGSTPSPKPRKPSKRSSTSTTRTGATATTT